jgi:hypothetical protein
MNEQDRLDFVDARPHVEGALGTEPWLTVYEHTKGAVESVDYFSALVPPDKVSDCLQHKTWDLFIGHGLPGRVYSGDESERTVTAFIKSALSIHLIGLWKLERHPNLVTVAVHR